MTLIPGNQKIIAAAFQSDKDTPATDPTVAWPVTAWAKDPVRVISSLQETDASAQEAASRVSAITPGAGCDLYLRASIMDFIAEWLLGQNTDTSYSPGYEHTAVPILVPKYATVWEIEHGHWTNRYDGVVCAKADLDGSEDNWWQVKNLAALALGFTAHVSEPAGALALAQALEAEAPLVWAETAVSYDYVHPGLTKALTLTIDRQASRAQGDSGFRAFDVALGKLKVTGTITRYMVDDSVLREVDTGSPTGTTPTTTVPEHELDVLIDRSADHLKVLIASLGVSYLTDDTPIDISGLPKTEVLGIQTQPQSSLGSNISLVTVNGKATPESAMP